jgi:hypothetical protein
MSSLPYNSLRNLLHTDAFYSLDEYFNISKVKKKKKIDS